MSRQPILASPSRDDDDTDDAAGPRIQSEREGFDLRNFPDNFYTGLIVFLDRARGRGVIRSHSGREIPFEFPFVAVVDADIGGRMPGLSLLNEGDNVGFDVGWTSKGLRVTKIKPAIRTDKA